MTLDNLLDISLEKIEPNNDTISRLLAAAERNLADSHIQALSAENRFDVAYKAIMQLAILALHANGFRTLTNRPGHHQTAIQTLPLTIGIAKEKMIILDALRKQRNLSDYSGDIVPKSAMHECITCASDLLAKIKNWLELNKPDLLNP